MSSADLYQELVLEHFHRPQHQGQIDTPTTTASNINASCGDAVTVDLQIDSQTGQIKDLKWRGQGCAISTAATSLLAEKIMDEEMTAAQVSNLNHKSALALLGLEEVAPGRKKCLELGLKTIQKALEQTEPSPK